MKCAVCGYDEAVPFKKILLSVFPNGHTEVCACPKCGTMRIDLDKTNNKFIGCKCPFCGNTNPNEFAVKEDLRVINRKNFKVFNVFCSCGASGSDAVTSDEAITKFQGVPF